MNELTRLKRSRDPGAKKTRQIYSQFLVDESDIHKTNFAIFHKIGTCQESGYLLGHRDRDCGSRIENIIKRHLPFISAIFENYFVAICIGSLKMLSKTALYFVDIVKDIKFIVIFYSVRFDRSKKSNSKISGILDVVLSAAIAFLILSELMKMLQLYKTQGRCLKQKMVKVILSPFQLIPIFIHHLELKLELKMCKLCAISEPTDDEEESLTNTRNEIADILRLKGEQRATENILEHFVQLLLAVTVLILSSTLGSSLLLFSRWYSFDANLLNLSESEVYFSIASSIISVLSMVRGQINLISSAKSGQMGLIATFVIAIYMIVAIFARTLIIISSILATIEFIRSIDDLYEEAQFISAYFNSFSEILQTHGRLIFILSTITVALFHIIFSYLIQKWLLRGKKSNLKEALWSILSPPLYLDWEYLYRKEDFEMPIQECWKRSRNSFLFHNLLTFIGNLALGIPLYILNHYSYDGLIDFYDENNWFVRAMDYDIDNWQMQQSRLLFPLILAIASQPILIGLGFLYFKKFHQWARILQAELTNSHQSRPNDKSEMRPRRHSFHVNPSRMEMQEENDPLKIMKLRRRSL